MRVVETPAHLLECQAYLYLRRGIDPELVEEDRAPYLSKGVLLRRKEVEGKLRSRSSSKEQELGYARQTVLHHRGWRVLV